MPPLFCKKLERVTLLLCDFCMKLLKKYQDPKQRHHKEIPPADKPFTGMVMCLSGRLSRTHVRKTTSLCETDRLF